MSNYNLTNQEISSSFQQVMQHDKPTGLIYDGTGSLIENLSVTSSEATHALTASYAENAANPQWTSIQNKPSGLVSGAAQVDALLPSGTVSGSTQVLGGTNIVSSSAQVKDFLPSGTVSGSSQITDGSTIVSGSYVSSIIAGSNISIDQASGNVTINSTTTASADWNNLTNKPAGIVSGSSQLTASYDTRYALSGSSSVPSGTISGSQQVINSLPTGTVSGSSQVILEDTTFTDGLEFQVLRTDGAGNLSFDYSDRTQSEIRTTEAITKGDPLYVVGFNNGQNRIEVGIADASDASKMPSFGLAYETVGINQNSQMVNLGSLDDIDTQVTNDFQVGDTVYVAVGGGLTNVKPTGTNLIQNVGVVGRRNQNNGEILVSAIGRSNDLPNIQNGYTWVGDGSGVPQAVATSSFAGGGGTIDTGSFATTGSNVFVGNQTISGSTTLQDTSMGPGTTFTVKNGGASPAIQIDNNALAGITGTAISANGNTSLTGDLTITGDTTLTGDSLQNGAGLLSGSLIVKDASGAGPINIFDVNNSTNTIIGVSNPALAGITGTEIVLNAQNGNTRFDGGASSIVESKLALIVTSSNATTVIKDAQAGPANTFVVNDSSTDIISVANSTLAGIVGSSVTVQGNSVFSGNQTVTGKQVISDILEVTGSTGQAVNIKDAQAAPGSVFSINDGTNNVFNVNNAALAGITGETFSFAGKSNFTQDVKFGSKISSTVGTVPIASSTASIDFGDSQVQVLNLPSSGDTHIVASNVGDGQVVNVLVKVATSIGVGPTVSLAPNFLQPSGSEYTSTTAGNSRDILTFATYDNSTTSEIYLINVVNLEN